jgi:cell division protein FtsZ
MSSQKDFKVVGVGGSGCAAVERMLGTDGCEPVAIHTDAKSLLDRKVPNKVLIGLTVTKGRSTGNNMKLGEQAALADLDKIKAALEGTKVTFVIAGIGGGTGAGAAPIVAQAAKSQGSQVIAFVNVPFLAEGKICRNNAMKAIEGLRPYCNLLVIIENDRFLKSVPEMSIRDAFTKVNHMLLEAVRGMVKLTSDSGIENIRSMLAGYATLGHGAGPTLKKAVDAALESPLIGGDIKEASAVMLEFTTHTKEVEGIQEALDAITQRTSPQSGIIWTNSIEDGEEAVEVLAIFSGVKPHF